MLGVAVVPDFDEGVVGRVSADDLESHALGKGGNHTLYQVGAVRDVEELAGHRDGGP